MTLDEMQKMIQGIFDGIFNSVTQAAPGGKPIMAATSTVLSLMKPGLAINPADFRNPWTPGNNSGNQDAALNTARLADVAPKLSAIYTPSGNAISQMYKQILDGISIPAQKPNPAIEKQLADADAVLYRTVDMVDPDTGETTPTRIQTVLYRDYLTNQSDYNILSAGYTAAYLAAQETATGRNTWPLIAGSLQLPVRQAYDKWRANGAGKVEEAMAIINTSSQNALQKAWDGAKKLYEGYGVTLDDSGKGLTVDTVRSSLLPTNWYSTNSTGWTTHDSASSSVKTSATSDYKSYGGSAGFSLGLFSIGGSAGHTATHQHASAETTGLRFSFSHTLVTISRPWLTYNLMATKGWNLGNLYSKGKLSNGAKTGQDASAWPLLPTAFVAAKDLWISAKWSKSDRDLIKKSLSAGGGFSIGPFSIGGSYASSSSNATYQASFVGDDIKIDGVQLIGCISQIVPYSPPT